MTSFMIVHGQFSLTQLAEQQQQPSSDSWLRTFLWNFIVTISNNVNFEIIGTSTVNATN